MCIATFNSVLKLFKNIYRLRGVGQRKAEQDRVFIVEKPTQFQKFHWNTFSANIAQRADLVKRHLWNLRFLLQITLKGKLRHFSRLTLAKSLFFKSDFDCIVQGQKRNQRQILKNWELAKVNLEKWRQPWRFRVICYENLRFRTCQTRRVF